MLHYPLIASGLDPASREKKSVVQTGSKPDGKQNQVVASLIYPPEIRSDTSRPCMLFTAHERKLGGEVHQHRIWFPAPGGLAFGDSADYGQSNLGMFAGAVDLATGNSNRGSLAGKLKNTNVGEIAALAAKVIPNLAGASQEGAQLAIGKIDNPSTNTTFTNNGVRQFTFGFKMVARDASESNLIRDIHSKFRHFVYASRGSEQSTVTLEYPPVWSIKFMNMDSGTENKYIPRIYSCYCTAVNSTFNEAGNIYFNDDAPLDVSLNLTFTETRALNRHDIEAMENDQLGNRGIDENGRPLTVTNLEQPTPAPVKKQ